MNRIRKAIYREIVEYAMLKLASNVPPSEIRAGIWMYLSKQCIVFHTFPAHCISTFCIYSQLLCNSTFHVKLKYSTFIVP